MADEENTNAAPVAEPKKKSPIIMIAALVLVGLALAGGISYFVTTKLMAVLTILSIAPSILIMTTSFIRIVVVLGFLRNALSTQNVPPNQVVIALSLFLSFYIMNVGEIQKVLANLLRERVSIRDIGTILEVLADYARATKDTEILTEYARHEEDQASWRVYHRGIRGNRCCLWYAEGRGGFGHC